MRKITSHEISLSALACAMATICLTIGIYLEVFLFTAYLLASIALMLPLAKNSVRGYLLAYIATCLLSLLFNIGRFFDLLPFIVFFGLHPFLNEMQLKIKINRWLACLIKALWFDGAMYLVWRFIFSMTTSVAFVDEYFIPILLVVGTLFFVFYDYATYKARAIVNTTVARITKK